MSWNKAAMQWANYRTPKPRVMHAPVGCSMITLGEGCDVEYDETHRCCGYHVCHCAPKPSNAELCAAANARMHADMQPELRGNGSWEWAKARMIEDACTVRGVSRQFRNLQLRYTGSGSGSVSFEYQWSGREEWVIATLIDQRALGKELFEVVE